VSVDEDFIASCVPVSASLGGVAEQCCRKPVESPELRLVALSADVDNNALTARDGTVVM